MPFLLGPFSINIHYAYFVALSSLFHRIPRGARQSRGQGLSRTRLGEKTLQNHSARTWECTEVIFVGGDQKAFTFRCFPDMNIQHPYWNLNWVSLSQGSFHQCLLPQATADWQPKFSIEQAGKKGRSGGVRDMSGVKLGRAGTDEWRGTEGAGGRRWQGWGI